MPRRYSLQHWRNEMFKLLSKVRELSRKVRSLKRENELLLELNNDYQLKVRQAVGIDRNEKRPQAIPRIVSLREKSSQLEELLLDYKDIEELKSDLKLIKTLKLRAIVKLSEG